MKRPPDSFTGKFSLFYSQYIEPNLPSVERVLAFDRYLRDYLARDDPLFVVRQAGTLTRGLVRQSHHGHRLLATDNSPVWWLHAFLLSEAPLPADPQNFFASLPSHMFRLPRGQSYLNRAGYHAAHLVNAKDGNTNWEGWDRSELELRTLRNIHPCNMVLIAKHRWQAHGGRGDILAWVISKYQDRYGPEIMSDCSGPTVNNVRSSACLDPDYEYEATVQAFENQPTSVNTRRSSSSKGRVRRTKRPFVSKKLEGTGTTLEISTPAGFVQIPHDTLLEWVRAHTNALNTFSWREKGHYSWRSPSTKMTHFLCSFTDSPDDVADM